MSQNCHRIENAFIGYKNCLKRSEYDDNIQIYLDRL